MCLVHCVLCNVQSFPIRIIIDARFALGWWYNGVWDPVWTSLTAKIGRNVYVTTYCDMRYAFSVFLDVSIWCHFWNNSSLSDEWFIYIYILPQLYSSATPPKRFEGHQNPISGSKVTTILLKGWIFPIGGLALGRVCACSLRNRLVCLINCFKVLKRKTMLRFICNSL